MSHNHKALYQMCFFNISNCCQLKNHKDTLTLERESKRLFPSVRRWLAAWVQPFFLSLSVLSECVWLGSLMDHNYSWAVFYRAGNQAAAMVHEVLRESLRMFVKLNVGVLSRLSLGSIVHCVTQQRVWGIGAFKNQAGEGSVPFTSYFPVKADPSAALAEKCH